MLARDFAPGTLRAVIAIGASRRESIYASQHAKVAFLSHQRPEAGFRALLPREIGSMMKNARRHLVADERDARHGHKPIWPP